MYFAEGIVQKQKNRVFYATLAELSRLIAPYPMQVIVL